MGTGEERLREESEEGYLWGWYFAGKMEDNRDDWERADLVSFWQREGGGGWLREDEKLGFLGFLSFSDAPPQIFSALASKFSSLFIDKNIIFYQMLGKTSVF